MPGSAPVPSAAKRKEAAPVAMPERARAVRKKKAKRRSRAAKSKPEVKSRMMPAAPASSDSSPALAADFAADDLDFAAEEQLDEIQPDFLVQAEPAKVLQ